MWPKRRAVIVLAVSWVLWCCVELHLKTDWGALWAGTDHLSHVAHAELFLRRGIDIYRKPLRSLCAKTLGHSADSQCPKGDLCEIAGLPRRKPVCVEWDEYPAPYPLGLILYSLPDTLLYEATTLSPRAVGYLTILKYLLATQALAWLLFRLVFMLPRTNDPFAPLSAEGWARNDAILRWGLFLLSYLEILRWTFAGFYDALAVCPLLLLPYFISQKRHADAFLAFAIAAVLQYRALWYLPVAGLSVIHLLRNRDWTRSRRDRFKVVVAVILGIVSAVPFLMLLPALNRFPQTNGVFVLRPNVAAIPASAINFVLLTVILLAYLARSGQWIMFSSILWQGVMIVTTPQGAPWHAMFLLPLLAVARLEQGWGATVTVVAFSGIEALTAFQVSPSAGDFLLDVVKYWGSVTS